VLLNAGQREGTPQSSHRQSGIVPAGHWLAPRACCFVAGTFGTRLVAVGTGGLGKPEALGNRGDGPSALEPPAPWQSVVEGPAAAPAQGLAR
jgi:hypothetical protein